MNCSGINLRILQALCKALFKAPCNLIIRLDILPYLGWNGRPVAPPIHPQTWHRSSIDIILGKESRLGPLALQTPHGTGRHHFFILSGA